MPARVSMIIVMKLSGSWKPRAAERIRPTAAVPNADQALLGGCLVAAIPCKTAAHRFNCPSTELPEMAGTCHQFPFVRAKITPNMGRAPAGPLDSQWLPATGDMPLLARHPLPLGRDQFARAGT